MIETNISAARPVPKPLTAAVVKGGEFPPLHLITRPTVTTTEAAFYLNRTPQTLRFWACREAGPLRPVRVNGRLAWSVAKIRQLLGLLH